MKRIGLACLAAALLSGCGSAPSGPSTVSANPDTGIRRTAAVPAPSGFLAAFGRSGNTLTWSEVVSQAGRSDVVYLGELHDDPATHELELATLRALAEGGRRPVALSLEMFETDVQGVLNAYLKGTITERDFLAGSRPWPNYGTDYRPLVEYAKSARIPVVASNVPRRLASMVAKGGLPALAGLPAAERQWAAIPDSAPADAYWEEFKQFGHPGMNPADLWKWYEAQVLKDETMARSITTVLAGSRPVVLHVNGAFHSDKALGVPSRVTKLQPGSSRTVMTARPAEGASSALPGDLAGLADIAILVEKRGTATYRGKVGPDRP